MGYHVVKQNQAGVPIFILNKNTLKIKKWGWEGVNFDNKVANFQRKISSFSCISILEQSIIINEVKISELMENTWIHWGDGFWY